MRHIIWILLLSTGIVACTTVTPPPTPSTQIPWKERQLALSKLNAWHINGKIGIQTTNDSGSAVIDWQQRQGQYTISLSGPLGSGGMKLSGQPGNVVMITPNGQHLSATSPEQLLAKAWGWNLPVSHLNYWIRGLPVPNIPYNSHFDNYNRLSDLIQEGWNIQYLDYTKAGALELPNKMSISSPSLKSKIIIYQWQVS